MWRSLFLVNLQACRLIAGNFSIKWTPSQVFFDSVLSPPMLPPCIDLSPPHQVLKSPPPGFESSCSCSHLKKDQLLSLFSYIRQFSVFFNSWRIDDWKPRKSKVALKIRLRKSFNSCKYHMKDHIFIAPNLS